MDLNKGSMAQDSSGYEPLSVQLFASGITDVARPLVRFVRSRPPPCFLDAGVTLGAAWVAPKIREMPVREDHCNYDGDSAAEKHYSRSKASVSESTNSDPSWDLARPVTIK